MMKERDIRFDYIRVLSMFYIVAVLHLSQYIELSTSVTKIYNPWISSLFTDLALSLFSMISGYLIGSRYKFGDGNQSVFTFYKKRIVRFYPLFFIASWALFFIGFNSLPATVNGLLGIAVFVKNEPRTLWYVSMIMLFYLITPIINRKQIWWRICSSCFFVLIAGIAFKLFKNVDFRLVYNLAFYCLGIVCSNVKVPFIDREKVIVNNEFQKILNIIVVVMFAIAVPLSFIYCRSAFWGVILLGILAVFGLANILSSVKSVILTKAIQFCSYGSMVCYMFHRVFYYFGLFVYNADNQTNRGGVFTVCHIPRLRDMFLLYPEIVRLHS